MKKATGLESDSQPAASRNFNPGTVVILIDTIQAWLTPQIKTIFHLRSIRCGFRKPRKYMYFWVVNVLRCWVKTVATRSRKELRSTNSRCILCSYIQNVWMYVLLECVIEECTCLLSRYLVCCELFRQELNECFQARSLLFIATLLNSIKIKCNSIFIL